MSVILATIDTDNTEPKKIRTITIYKAKVFNDIELHTYKHVDASDSPNPQSRNAIQADKSEAMDGNIIARNVEFRNAQLRKRLQKVLTEENVESANDTLAPSEETYVYSLNLPESFADSTLRALAEYFHRFLVWGALYDWYDMLGVDRQAENYGAKVAQIEEDINGALRGPSITKRPLQPFGPAYKFIP